MFLGTVQSQTGPINRQSNVSATVSNPDTPTTPILISPGNGDYVTVTKPSFVWNGSTDDNGIDEYEFWLDGSLLFDNIPAADQDTSEYDLDYDGSNNRFTLTPKDALAQGTHTWKIRVYDNLGEQTDSATWSFTVDSQAPSFVVEQIGAQTTSISAQDPSSYPTQPITLIDNEPEILAQAEANSTVTLTVTIPGDPTQSYTTTADSNGDVALQLGFLPRETVITLDFTITDLAGNATALNGIEIFIEAIGATPTPSPTPPSSPEATPSPDVTPEPSPSASPSPSPSPTSTAVILPSAPPAPPAVRRAREGVLETIQEAAERAPTPLRNIIERVPEPVKRSVENTARRAAPASSFIAATALPAAGAAALATQFGGSISLNIILRILQALGLLPKGKPKGLVFDSKTFDPIPFARITINAIRQIESGPLISETVITDQEGVYRDVTLPPGTYRMSVSKPGFLFPAEESRPSYLSTDEYYLGEEFTVTNRDEGVSFLIPMTPKADSKSPGGSSITLWERIRLGFSNLGSLSQHLQWPMWFLSGLFALIFPTWLNIITFGIYSGIMLYQIYQALKPPLVTGIVIDENGQPIENVVIRFADPVANELRGIAHTDESGEFEADLKSQSYHITVVRAGYTWQTKTAVLSLFEVDLSDGQRADLELHMRGIRPLI